MQSRRLDLTVQYVVERQGLPLRPAFVRWARAALAAGVGGSITLRLVDEAEGRMLNHEYRGKDYATNVLSFPYEYEPRVLGDLVLCTPVIAREAQEQGKPLEAHYVHMVVHGILHLQGMDHVEEEEAEAMEALERALMAKLGYPDPYRNPYLNLYPDACHTPLAGAR